MGFALTGTRGEPFVASAGNPPTFAADMSGISTFFASRVLREFATVAAMVASTGSGANEWAKCDNVAGALYYSDGTRWYLGNQPTVATLTAQNALFSGTCQPIQGNEVYRSDFGIFMMYSALYNSGTNPGGATPAGWAPAPGADAFLHMDRGAAQSVANAATATALGDTFGLLAAPRGNNPFALATNIYTNGFYSWDRSAGSLKVILAGDYDIEAMVQWPQNSGGTPAIALTKNAATAGPDANTLSYDSMTASANQKPMLKVKAKNVPLITTDVVRLVLFNNAGGAAINAGGDAFPSSAFLDIRYVGPTHA